MKKLRKEENNDSKNTKEKEPKKPEKNATYFEALAVILFMIIAVTGGFIELGLKVELLMIISAVFLQHLLPFR